MNDDEKRRNFEKIVKRDEAVDLLHQAELGRFWRYFDTESFEMLDQKIRVLKEVIAGKPWDEIEGFYEIFEKIPKDGLWD